jgi:hypothetical protein
MEFKVKRDFLLILFTNLVLIFLLFVPFLGLGTEAAIFFLIIFGIVLTILIMFDTAAIFASCELQNNVLVFKTGAFKKVIFLDKMIEARRVNTITGSFIISTDRIEIVTLENGKRVYYYVSVVDNEKLFDLISANLPKKAPVVAENANEEKAEVAKKETVAKKTVGKKSAKKPAEKKAKKTVEKKSSK